MLYLNKLFNDLSAGDYSQLNFGSGAGVIDDNNMDKVISHINSGLFDLFSRFDLRFKTVQIALQYDQTEYYLTSKNALNNPKAVDPKFIIDSETDKFQDDILEILGVTLDSGAELTVNSFSHKFTASTPSFNRLKLPIQIVNQMEFLPKGLISSNAFIKYKANHPAIDMDVGGFDPDKFVIELPMTHYNALMYFCASRATRPLGLNNQFNSGLSYASMYEAECSRLKGNTAEVHETGDQSKFYARGFV